MDVDGKDRNDFLSFSEENPFHIVQTPRNVVRASFCCFAMFSFTHHALFAPI